MPPYESLPYRPCAGIRVVNRAGQVFVALKTDKRDGHDFLGEARKRGAAAALVNRAIPGEALPKLVVNDPLAAFQRIARNDQS